MTLLIGDNCLLLLYVGIDNRRVPHSLRLRNGRRETRLLRRCALRSHEYPAQQENEYPSLVHSDPFMNVLLGPNYCSRLLQIQERWILEVGYADCLNTN